METERERGERERKRERRERETLVALYLKDTLREVDGHHGGK